MLGIAGIGVIAFSPLAQGLLSEKYLEGVPEASRCKNLDGGAARAHYARIPGEDSQADGDGQGARSNIAANGAGLGVAPFRKSRAR